MTNLSNKGYFQRKLIHYLNIYHPHLIDDKVFIENRCGCALDIYETSRHTGESVSEALQLAHEILFEGLELSVYRIILSFLEENYPQETVNMEPIARWLLPLCQKKVDLFFYENPSLEKEISLVENFTANLLHTIIKKQSKHVLQQKKTSP